MKTYRTSANASSIYRESASANIVEIVSAAVPGNLADIAQNTIILQALPTLVPADITTQISFPDDDPWL